MKKNSKGFTLVELLAVIVILAVILIIAVPQISGIINKAKQDTDESSAKMIVKAAETAIARGTIEGAGTYTCSVLDVKVNTEDAQGNAINTATASDCSVVVDANLNVSTVTYGDGIQNIAPSAIDDVY